MTALIAGFGYVGRGLADLLLADGQPLWTLRRGVEAGAPAPGMISLRADLGDRAELERVLGPVIERGQVDVYFLASPDAPHDDAYRAVYVDGLRSLCEVLAKSLRRVLLTTSTAVYGQDDGSWVDETSLTDPSSFSGKRLLEGEQLLGELAPSGVALRLGGIYGGERTSLVKRLLDGQAIAPLAAPQYRNRIHRDDCARVLRDLARLPRPQAVYVGVDDEPADLREVQGWLCAQLGIDPAALRPATSSSRGGNKRCSNARLREAGVALAYPSYREGYAELLDGFRNSGSASG